MIVSAACGPGSTGAASQPTSTGVSADRRVRAAITPVAEYVQKSKVSVRPSAASRTDSAIAPSPTCAEQSPKRGRSPAPSRDRISPSCPCQAPAGRGQSVSGGTISSDPPVMSRRPAAASCARSSSSGSAGPHQTQTGTPPSEASTRVCAPASSRQVCIT